MYQVMSNDLKCTMIEEGFNEVSGGAYRYEKRCMQFVAQCAAQVHYPS